MLPVRGPHFEKHSCLKTALLAGSGWFESKLELLILHHIRWAPFSLGFIVTKMSQRCWPIPYREVICHSGWVFATQFPAVSGSGNQAWGVRPGHWEEGACGFVG